MTNSEIFRDKLAEIRGKISSIIIDIVGGDRLDLNSSVVTGEFGDDTEAIVSVYVNEKGVLMVDADYCHDINQYEFSNYILDIQLTILEMLEKGEYEFHEAE